MERISTNHTVQEIAARIERIRELNRDQSITETLASGQDSQRTNEPPLCAKCGDADGWMVQQPAELTRPDGTVHSYTDTVWRPCECAQWKRVLKASKVSPAFKNMRFDNFTREDRPQCVKEAYSTAKAYLHYFDAIKGARHNSLAFLGNPGGGKTHLLSAVSNELMARGVPVIYFPWVEGWNEIKNDLGQLDAIIGKLQRVDVLFIDDLFKGREQPTPLQLEQTFAVINHRRHESKPILLSSEWDFERIIGVDEGIGSRIYEMCKEYNVFFKGDKTQLNWRLR